VEVPEKKRHHAKCYRDMLVEKIGAINNSTATVNKYMDDIQEYLKQLEKIGLILPVAPEPKKVIKDTVSMSDAIIEEPKPVKPKESPLIP